MKTCNVKTLVSRVALVSGSFVLHFLSVGIPFSFGVIYNEIASVFELGDGETGWVPSLFSGLLLGTGLMSGILVSVYGPHTTTVIGSLVMTVGMVTSGFVTIPYLLYITYGVIAGLMSGILVSVYGPHTTTVIGSLVMTVGMVTSAFVTIPYLLYITYGVIAGCSGSLLLIAGIVVINEEFTDRRTVAMGIASTGGSIGTIILPFFTSWCIDVYGWRGAFILLGGLCLQGVVAGMLFYSAKKTTVTPQEQAIESAIPPKRSPFQKCRSLFSFFNGLHICFVVASTISFTGLFIPYNLLYKMMISKGQTRAYSSLTLSLAGVGNIVTRVSVGFLGDYKFCNRIYFFILANMISGCVTFACVHLTVFWQFLSYGFLFGMSTGIIFLRSIITTDLVGVENIGPAFGFLTMSEGIGSAIGTPVGGWMADAASSYNNSFYFSGSCFLLCGLISASIPMRWHCTRGQRTKPDTHMQPSARDKVTSKQVDLPPLTNIES